MMLLIYYEEIALPNLGQNCQEIGSLKKPLEPVVLAEILFDFQEGLAW